MPLVPHPTTESGLVGQMKAPLSDREAAKGRIARKVKVSVEIEVARRGRRVGGVQRGQSELSQGPLQRYLGVATHNVRQPGG